MIKIIQPGKEMLPFVIAYDIVILTMVISALQVFISHGSPFGVLILAGGLCILTSDSILAFFTFKRKPRYGDLAVMSSYIGAQLCLALGLSGM
jgi:uncharacterized membrane protein YhhN